MLAGTFPNKKDADRAWQRAEAKIAEGRLGDPGRGRQTFQAYVEQVWLPGHQIEALRCTADLVELVLSQRELDHLRPRHRLPGPPPHHLATHTITPSSCKTLTPIGTAPGPSPSPSWPASTETADSYILLEVLRVSSQ